jgi:hypothetical protein
MTGIAALVKFARMPTRSACRVAGNCWEKSPIAAPLGLQVVDKLNFGSVREVLQKPLRRNGHGMRVMSQSPDPLARMHTMTKRQGKSGTIDVKALVAL